MLDLKALLNQRVTLKNDMAALNEATIEGERDLTEDEQKQWDGFKSKVALLDGQIKRGEEVAETERTMRAVPDPAMEAAAVGEDEIEAMLVTGGDAVLRKDPKWGFRSAGEFFSVMNSHFLGRGVITDPRLEIMAATGMSQGTGSDGGFTVAPAFSTGIWDGLNTGVDSLLSRCDVYTVEGESLTFNANAETSRATGSRYGGIRGYWLNEAGQLTKSKPAFRQMKLEPQELGCLVWLTNKLMRNSDLALTQYINSACTEEMNFMIGDAIFNGTGVGQPTGFIGNTSVVSVGIEDEQAAETVVKENIDKMWSRCHARPRAGASWFINQDVEPALEKLAADVGTGGIPVYLPPGGITDAPNARLKGKPVEIIEYCPTIGTVGDIVLANLKYYAIGVQGSIETAMSMHLRFDYNETALRLMWAVDGKTWLASKITPYKGGASKARSPIVTLATRS